MIRVKMKNNNSKKIASLSGKTHKYEYLTDE